MLPSNHYKKKVSWKFLILLLFFAQGVFSKNLISSQIANNIHVIQKNNIGFVENEGFSNAAFIIGKSGVIVIDTGISHQTGKQIIDIIKEKTKLPIVLVILTHANENFVLGSSAFYDLGINIGAHPSTIELIEKQCGSCLASLRAKLEIKMMGTRLITPNVSWSKNTSLKIGGTQVDLLHFGTLKTAGDLMVFHPESQTLFSGGVISSEHVPNIKDGDLDNWLTVISKIKALNIIKIVPAFGKIISDVSNLDTEKYLLELRKKVGQLYNNSESLIETINQAEMIEFSGWSAYYRNHKKNVQRCYLQIELKDFLE